MNIMKMAAWNPRGHFHVLEFFGVIVDQAANQNDVALFTAQVGQSQCDGTLRAILDQDGVNTVAVAFQQGADAGNVKLIAGLNVQLFHTGQNEGEHTPVNDVGAVTLGGKLRHQNY